MTWRQYTCDISGKPAIILVDDRFAQQERPERLHQLSWFGVYCAEPPGAHLWAREETKALDQIEDDLVELAETFGHNCAVYVLRIATPGIREHYIYHSDSAELSKAFSALKAVHPDYRIEFETIDDPNWDQYKKYVAFRLESSP